MRLVLLIAATYLIGSISPSYILGMLFRKLDIRKHGSGNAGSTNAIRVLGKKLGLLTFVIDFLKGLIAVLLSVFFKVNYAPYIAMLGAVLGHVFPFYMNFRGGKGVATTLGAIYALDWKFAISISVIMILIIVLIRFVSVASMSMYLSFFLYFAYVYKGKFIVPLIIVLFITILGLVKHRQNLYRLIKGKENKIERR